MSRGRIVLLVAGIALAAGGGWVARYGLPNGAPAKAPATEEALPPPGPGGPPGAGGGRRAGQRNEGPTPVVVTPARREDVEVTIEGIGTVQADATVTVRAQVEGRLLEVRFREGQEVEAGDVLAVIDPASYRAIYDQAVGKRDQNAADLANARADLDRYERLARSESGSRQQADTQRATVAKLEAQTRIDQGVIDAAKIDLDNTTVRAPISGRTGIRSVDVGNLVRASDASGLVTIARLRPIVVVFTVPQQRLGQLQAAQARGEVAITVQNERGESVDRGRVEVVDNQVDQTTGTVKVKASLPNRDLRLWPGQFVDVRAKVDTLVGALTVPSAAVQRSADGPWVYVVGEGDVAHRRMVTVARQDATRAVIASGLEVGEKVVTTGFARLSDGGAVKPSEADVARPEEAAKTEGAPASRRRGEGRPGGSGPSGTPATGTPPNGAPAPGGAGGAAAGSRP